jgi:hypothetical protein
MPAVNEIFKLANSFIKKLANDRILVDDEGDKIIVYYEGYNSLRKDTTVTPAVIISIAPRGDKKFDSFDIKWVDDKHHNNVVPYEDQSYVLQAGLKMARQKWPHIL